MTSPIPDACSLAIGDDSLLADADGMFDVPDVHVDRLVALGWERHPVPDPNMPQFTLRPDAAAAQGVATLVIAQDGKIVEPVPAALELEVSLEATGATAELTGTGEGEALPPIDDAAGADAGDADAADEDALEEPLPPVPIDGVDDEKAAAFREAIAAGFSEAEAREMAYGVEP